MFGWGGDERRRSGGGADSLTGLTVQDHVAIAKAPKLTDRPSGGMVRDIIGKVWNAPNTLIGSAYAGLGHSVAEVEHLIDPQHHPQPRIIWAHNATQYLNNPAATPAGGGLTIGNVTMFDNDPYSSVGKAEWAGTERNEHHPVTAHEEQHTYQGEQLGPAYLPSNIIGGAMGWLFDRGRKDVDPWHGPHNWNERGPQLSPPRPWAPKPR